MAYDKALNTLKEKVRVADDSGLSIKKKDVVEIIGSKTPLTEDLKGQMMSSGAQSVEVYSWFTLNFTKPRKLYVYYAAGNDPDVTLVHHEPDITFGELIEQQKKDAASKEGDKDRPGMGPPIAPGGGPPGGGPPRGGPPGGGAPAGGPPASGKAAAATENKDQPDGDEDSEDKAKDTK